MTENKTVEVWVRAAMNHMGVSAMTVSEDESTQELDVDSLSVRGAQREVTGFMIKQGLEPAGRWEDTDDDDETFRVFRRRA